MKKKITTIAALFLAGTAAAPALAQDIKLPPTMAFTAYDTGTSGFNIAVGVGKVLKDKYGSDVRVLPAGNDVARLAPLRTNRAVLAWMGTGVYFAQEGVFEFGVKEWGPQALQMTLSTVDCNGLSVGVAKDTGVKEWKDFKGKRLGFVVGSPALNQNALAIIAYGGLTQKDVKIVEFASYGAMWKGLVNNDADGAFASTVTGPAKEVETSPRGLVWPELPPEDKAAWERVKKVGAFFNPHVTTCGAGITPASPLKLAAYPYPIATTYASQSVDQIYALTKAMISGYDGYKDSAPGASGLDVKKQTKQWVIPYHPGAAKALKEAGQWTDADEKYNNDLIKRQGVLADAWKAYNTASAPGEPAAFLSGWMAARKAALAKANLPNGFD
ncbi:TAXI family TRAP transporter solute-binding subunit [Afipia clevelandensis]|uniref:TAXI family TRAP transporter solute receptor n=1 Tax=Afipia clevelandensis ATCC 49720 TaxID=883079 RepID=K8PT63_9BRAD|nr:TAXI family TRAP transporter solute-binding subunit [Afipia clevelandensis]EGP07699.1 TRAP transporter solute receptor, TAXI family precursor [Bradyrhizobiaceae bacterium SG-6C]EKS42725.1 TAXI family TRAP transporter solute receptor [Afipia clevelandensis ATCC 49720]